MVRDPIHGVVGGHREGHSDRMVYHHGSHHDRIDLDLGQAPNYDQDNCRAAYPSGPVAGDAVENYRVACFQKAAVRTVPALGGAGAYAEAYEAAQEEGEVRVALVERAEPQRSQAAAEVKPGLARVDLG